MSRNAAALKKSLETQHQQKAQPQHTDNNNGGGVLAKLDPAELTKLVAKVFGQGKQDDEANEGEGDQQVPPLTKDQHKKDATEVEEKVEFILPISSNSSKSR
jgi:hypothetical protein